MILKPAKQVNDLSGCMEGMEMSATRDFFRKLNDSSDVALYSLIYNRKSDKFTLSEIQKELSDLGLNLSDKEVRNRIDRFSCVGFVQEENHCYSRIPNV